MLRRIAAYAEIVQASPEFTSPGLQHDSLYGSLEVARS